MSEKFISVKSFSFGLILFAASLLLIFLAVLFPWFSGNIHSGTELIIRIVCALPLPGIFLWVWLGTYYLIENRILTVRSGPLVFRVPVSQISAVRLNQKTIGGLWKPTLSWNSVQIDYNKSFSVFISPAKQDEFIAELLKINPEIEIKQN